MNTFGLIKTKLEEASISTFKNKQFDKFMIGFKKFVLENKDMSELYYIYDDLSTNKGLSSDIVDDYINENIEYSRFLISENQKSISHLGQWISNIVKSNDNNYKNIDTLIYNNSIKNLESILESKKEVKNTLIKESKKEEIKESVNLPISTMVKVYESNLKNNLSLNETELKEISDLKNVSFEDMKKEMKELKESVSLKLKGTINESTDTELSSKIEETIKKVNDSKLDHYNLYKLRKLNEGL
jgi:hypothetical protein